MIKELPNLNVEKLKEYVIIEGNIKQLEQIVAVNGEIFKGMYESEPYSFNQYQERLKNLEPKIFVAKIGDRIIGNSISYNKENSLYVWIMGVLKDCRNKGIATKLFENNEQFAKENNYESVIAKVYNVSQEMIRLLLARNYQIVDIEKSDSNPKYNAVHLKLKI
ncbi:MAG: GCN5-related N-acetyltransferase [Candidatus Moranbacteria bacterium GW2011_GWE1_35_17]|nr:MAG: GCN5-related N-acetyltransferase [Candidatus Moranbacteria bacterium GW2011_GWE1_35_17]KKP81380.1 MAG: GCN5-related N-acetyltransferase [Candidatus Moranbacteria bacterium GW2011_GWF1_35_5]